MKQIVNKIVRVYKNKFTDKLEVENLCLKEVKKLLRIYFDYVCEDKDKYFIKMFITDVKVDFDTRLRSLKVTLVTHKPGLIIGVGGKHMDRLRDYLKKHIVDTSTVYIDELNIFELKLQIEENKLWI